MRGDGVRAHCIYQPRNENGETGARATVLPRSAVRAWHGRRGPCQKEDAIREGRRAVELLPVTKESIAGSLLSGNIWLLIYAWTERRISPSSS